MKKLILTAAAAVIAMSAAACGRIADLDAPPKRQTERSQRSGSGPAIPEPATIYRPPSTQPIDGGPTSPYNGPGASPNRR